MFDILTVGEILIDLTQSGISENGILIYSANPGGAPANVAVAASRLGASAAFIGKVGNDAYGGFLRETLEKNNVNTDGVVVDNSANTTLAVVSVNENGERGFAFYRKNSADTLLSENEITDRQLSNTHILHFGSVSLTDEPSRTATLSAVRRARALGATITYDPNYRASLWNSEAQAVEQMKKPLPFVDILKVSDEEIPLICGTDNIEEAAKQLCEQYDIKLVLVTLGAKGAYYRFKDMGGVAEGVKVTVADTNGAGDTFFGAFLSRLAHMKKYNPSELSKEDIKQALAFANRAAAITTSRSGAIPAMPTLDEVELVYRGEKQ